MPTLKDMEQQKEQLQGQRKAQFTELGKFVYEHFRKEEIDVILSMMKSVDDLDMLITDVDAAICQKKEELQQKQDEMHRRGLMICPNCQAEISDKSIFCNICGTRVEGLAGKLMAETEAGSEQESEAEVEPEVEPEAEVKLGAEVEPEVEVELEAEVEPEVEAKPETEMETEVETVSELSTDLDAYSDAVARQAEEDPVPTPVQQKPARICRKCGKPIGDGYLFCIYCGTKYEEEQPTPHQTALNQGVCPNCGAQNKPGYLFCIRCGTKLA